MAVGGMTSTAQALLGATAIPLSWGPCKDVTRSAVLRAGISGNS